MRTEVWTEPGRMGRRELAPCGAAPHRDLGPTAADLRWGQGPWCGQEGCEGEEAEDVED